MVRKCQKDEMRLLSDTMPHTQAYDLSITSSLAMLFDNPMFGKLAQFSTPKCLTIQMGQLLSDAVENASFGQNKKLGIGRFLYTFIFSVKIYNP